MTPWSAFFDVLSPDVPACPQEAQVSALRRAAIKFCEKSLIWKYDHPDIAVAAGTEKYLVDPPDETAVHTVTYAEFNGRQIDTSTMERDIRVWNWRTAQGMPEYLLSEDVAVTLVPTPDVPGTLSMKVALKPTISASGIEDWIFREYQEAIVHGALARLMLSPKKPYSDPALAGYHEQMFLIKTARAGVREAKSRNRTPLQTKIMKRR